MLQTENNESVSALARALTLLANHNGQVLALNKKTPLHLSPDKATPFDSSVIPQLPLVRYMNKIKERIPGSMTGVCFTAISMIVYAERIRKYKADFTITSYNVHRFFLATLVVTHKFFSDDCYLNSYLAKVGGVNPEELNNLELCLLNWLDFDLSITPSEFFNCRGFLLSLEKLNVMKFAIMINGMKSTIEIEKKLRKMARGKASVIPCGPVSRRNHSTSPSSRESRSTSPMSIPDANKDIIMEEQRDSDIERDYNGSHIPIRV